MKVYFEIRKLEVDEFIINTIITTFSQYMEKRQFKIYVGNIAFSEEKRSYWELKKDKIKKIKKENQITNEEYRVNLEKEHEYILKEFINSIQQGGE